jgi:hypothetical protein
MAGVIAAVKARYDIMLFGKLIYNAAFAFVTTLNPNYHIYSHAQSD